MKIFVSYSRKDADFAKQVYEYFKDSSHDIFTDVNNIKPGDVWSSAIETNISTCDVFVIIVTYPALSSPEIEKEILQAQAQKKKIIPAIHKSVKYNDIKWNLNRIQAIEFEDKYELARTLYLKIGIPQSSAVSVLHPFTLEKEGGDVGAPARDERRQQSNAIKRRIPSISPKILILIVVIGVVIGSLLVLNAAPKLAPLMGNQTETASTNTALTNRAEKNQTEGSTPSMQLRNSLIIEGNMLYEKGNYTGAASVYDKALQIEPTNVLALNGKGLALYLQGKYNESLSNFDKALQIDPNYKYALNNKGLALYHLGRYDDAIVSYDKALQIDPNYKYALNNKGLALYLQGRYDDAIVSYDKALQIDPNYTEALNNKGLALAKIKTNEQ